MEGPGLMTANPVPPTHPAPWDVRCKACHGWIVTIFGGCRKARVRCINKRCPLYAEPQERMPGD